LEAGTFNTQAKSLIMSEALFSAAVRLSALAGVLMIAGCMSSADANFANLDASDRTTLGASATNDVPLDVLDEEHKLTAGDKVSFRIVEDKEDPKPLVVTDSGDLEIPFLGRVAATDKTCKQLSHEIKAALEKRYYRHATVFIGVDLMSKTRGRIYLAGRVRLPGYQDIPADEVFTVSKAILRAGGFSEFADKRHVKVTHKSEGLSRETEIATVDIAEVLEKGQAGRDLKLHPDDRVFVPSRLVNF
jgi:protein involved in polysaccharide export with SLBB domain